MQVKIERPTIASVLPDWASEEAAAAAEPRTVVVFGMPRGGTTMVAGICQRCGIDMGTDLPKNLEDQDFVNKPLEEMIQSIEQRNATKPVWGWKFPRASAYLPELEASIRNPLFIIVWRDLLSVATRGIKNTGEMNKSLMIAHKIQTQNLDFVSATQAPVLHVSYEKSIRAPVALAEDIQRFTGVRKDFDKDELIAFAEPGSYK